MFPESPTQEIIDSWFDAAAKSVPPKSMAQIKHHLMNCNPVRWRRLQRDLRWLQKEMKKMGLNPDDARWIL